MVLVVDELNRDACSLRCKERSTYAPRRLDIDVVEPCLVDPHDFTPSWWPYHRDPPWTAHERRRVLAMRIRGELMWGVPVPPRTHEDCEFVLQAISEVRKRFEEYDDDELLESDL